MRTLKFGLAGASLLALGACSTAQQAQTTQVVQQAQQACVTLSPLLSLGANSTNAKAQSIASFGNAVCGPLAAGSVPPTVDSNTATWLGTLGGMLKVIVPIAATLL